MPHCHHDRIENDLTMDRRARGPADDLAGEQIDDDGQVEPALPSPNVGYIRDPGPIWASDRELPLENIRDNDRWLAHGDSSGPVPVQGAQTCLPHQALDSVLAARFTGFTQVEEDPWSAVDAVTGNEGGSDQTQKPSVLLSSIGDRLLKPLVVTALSDLEDLAHGLDAVLTAVGFNEPVDLADLSSTQLRGHCGSPWWTIWS